MDENDLKGLSDAMNELRETGTLSAESLAKLTVSGNSSSKSLEKFSKGMLDVGQKVGGLASTVAKGEGSFSSLGTTIEATSKMMGNLLSALPLVGGAAKALAQGVGEASKFVLDQLDIMAKNYQALGDVSAGAVDGVDGLMRQFNQLGNYSLPAFTKAVKANSLGLAAFRGTATQGAEELSKISGVLTTGQTAKQFLKLGMSLESVGDATTNYLATSARYGLLQGATTEELTKKTQNYIEEVDKIARLTGQSREAQQKEAQKSLADAKFRAKLAEMQASGQGAQAEELRKYVEGLGGAAGDAARALVTGIPLTKEAAQANLFSNDALRQNTIAIQQGKKATTAIADTQEALAEGTKQFGKQIMYAGDMTGGLATQAYDYRAMLEEQKKLEESGMTREQAIVAMQEKQKKASGKATEEFTDAQLATVAASKNLQSLGFTLANSAIPAVDAFASSLQRVTGFIDEKFGSGKKGGAGGETGGASMWDKLKNAFGLGSGKGPFGTGNVPSNKQIGTDSAKENAERYYGKRISDQEYTALVKATHAEAAAGKQASQKEQAMIMASILNRARSNEKGIIGALTAKNQFQSVTGTSKNNNQPSKEFITGPDKTRLKSIEDATVYLGKISKEQKNFTAASSAAYGPGTNIGYRDKMLASGGKVVGGTVFQTEVPDNISGPQDTRRNTLAGVNPASAGADTQAQSNRLSTEKQAELDIKMLSKQLTELNQTSRSLLDVNKKILARQA